MFDNRKLRLLIADNHRLVSEACKQLLEPEFDVVDIVTDGRELVQAAMRSRSFVYPTSSNHDRLRGFRVAQGS